MKVVYSAKLIVICTVIHVTETSGYAGKQDQVPTHFNATLEICQPVNVALTVSSNNVHPGHPCS